MWPKSIAILRKPWDGEREGVDAIMVLANPDKVTICYTPSSWGSMKALGSGQFMYFTNTGPNRNLVVDLVLGSNQVDGDEFDAVMDWREGWGE
jgi:hypothetical protein